MRFTLPTRRARSASGFTLIEMLIISPIVILAIGGFIALMVNMVGNVLVSREESALTYDTQSALDRIEQDVRLSTQFLVTSGTQTAQQGSDNNFTGTAAFSNASNTLLLSMLATDKNPADSTRSLVYIADQPNPCGGDQRYNRVFLTKVFYFIKSGSLWRRTVVPKWSTTDQADSTKLCSSPWQQSSCSPGYTTGATSPCQTNDEKIMDNITALNVQYFAEPSDTTPLTAAQATVAGAINVTINSQKTVAGGNVITNAGNVRVTKLNDIDTTQLPPAVPTLTAELADPNTAEFSWQSVPTATAYQIKYTVGSNPEISQTVDANTTSMLVKGNRGETITFRVASFNNAGSSAYSTASQALPNWATFTLGTSAAQWEDYSTTYNPHRFTKTAAGVVMLQGLIRYGEVGTDITIATLPEGYRPSSRLVFVASTYTAGGGAYDSGPARVAIWPDGKIVVSEANANWLSLDGITFLAHDPDKVWTNATFSNGWSNYSTNNPPTWQTLRATKDSVGRVHTQGTIDQGTIADGTLIATFPGLTSYLPQYYNLFPQKIDLGSGSFGTIGVNTSGIVARNISSAYINVDTMYYPNGTGTWTDVTPTSTPHNLQNSWVRYNTTYNMPGFIKGSDGIVSLRGLITKGTTPVDGETIFTLPPGYRPAKTNIFVVNRTRSYGRIDVLNDGRVIVRYVSPTWTSLDGIHFMAEQ